MNDNIKQSLLSLVLLSCMVVSIRELVNTLILFPSNLQSTQLIPSTPQQMDIEMNKTRDRSNISSPNSFRESSVHSHTLSMNHVERVQAMANNPTWAEQMDNNTIQILFLSYIIVKEGINVLMNPEVPMHVPHINETNNMYASQGIEPLIIPYTTN